MESTSAYLCIILPAKYLVHLELYCSLALLSSIAAGQSSPEWDKFGHVEHIKAYAREGDNARKWYVLYTANPCKLETNVSHSFMSRAASGSGEENKKQEEQTRTADEGPCTCDCMDLVGALSI